jgi:leucyl/phenylalanyl-tRNA--protein transferase
MHNSPSLMIPQLAANPGAPFPDPDSALDVPDGLLAWGGDLHPRRLRNAYRQGIFPWYSDGQPILWWNPARRCVLFPGQVHVSRRLRRLLRQQRFEVTADTAFAEVIAACARSRGDESGTWITQDMREAYTRLHFEGLAHSIEVWDQGRLAGGLYGIVLGGVFFGESMFSAVSNASKVALVTLCRQLESHGYGLLDCQLSHPHLLSMGAVEIPRQRFLELLDAHAGRPDPVPAFAELFVAG